MTKRLWHAAPSWPLVILALVVAALLIGQRPSQAETRFALVIGNDEYKSGKLTTPANDAGLIADTLQAAAFIVTGARNLDQPTLREALREFLGQVSAAGPDAAALVYLAGYGLQYEGDNYFVPVDAELKRDADIPLQAIRISDFIQALAALPGGRQNRHRRCGEAKSVRRQRPAAGGRARAGRSGAEHGDRLQRCSRNRRSRGARPLRRLCDGVGRDDVRRRSWSR
jgi:Caspase domain